MSKTVAITGMTRGIGRHLAQQFADHGYLVAGCGSNPALIDEAVSALGDGHLVRAVDVTDLEQVEHWAADIDTALGTPEIIVSNAGVINALAPSWEVPAAEFEHVINVNVTGVFNVAKAFVPRLIARGGGMLINLSSGWGRNGEAEVAPYCASKFAVEGFSKSLALEVPGSIKVFPMSPGVIDTDMLEKCYPGGHHQHGSPQDWGRVAFDYITSILPNEPSGASVSVPF
jgi:NAD(P)-dependent dehydrogenase (short-subunit alcohol dehydrogenase family)